MRPAWKRYYFRAEPPRAVSYRRRLPLPPAVEVLSSVMARTILTTRAIFGRNVMQCWRSEECMQYRNEAFPGLACTSGSYVSARFCRPKARVNAMKWLVQINSTEVENRDKRLTFFGNFRQFPLRLRAHDSTLTRDTWNFIQQAILPPPARPEGTC